MNRRDSTSSTDSWSIVHNRSVKEDDILMVDNDSADDASDILDSDIEIAEEAYNSYDDSDLELTNERSEDEETTDSECEVEREEERESEIGAEEAGEDGHEDNEDEENEEDGSEESEAEQEADSESEADEENDDNINEEQKPAKWCSIEDSEALEEEGKYYANPEKVKEKLGEFDCSPFDDWCLFFSRNKRVLATVIFQISIVVAVSAGVPIGMKLFADWMDLQIRSNCEPVKLSELGGLQSRWQPSIFTQEHKKRNALLPTFNASVLDEMRNLRKTRQALRIQPRRARSILPSQQLSFVPEMSRKIKPTTDLLSLHPTSALTVAPTVVYALRPVLSNETVPEPCGLRIKRRSTPIPCKTNVVILPETSKKAVKAVTYTITGDSHMRASNRRNNFKKSKNVRHTCPRYLAPSTKPVTAAPLTPPTLPPRTRHFSPLPPPSKIRHTPAKWHTTQKSASLTVLSRETSLRIIPTTSQRIFITGKSWQSARRPRHAACNISIPSRMVSPIWPMDVFPGMSLYSKKRVKRSASARTEKPKMQKADYFYCSTNKSVPLYCPARSSVKLPKTIGASKIASKTKRIVLNHRKSQGISQTKTFAVPVVIKTTIKQLPMVPPRKLVKLQKKHQKAPKAWNISQKSQTCVKLPLKESGLVKYQKDAKKIAKAVSRMEKKQTDLKVLLHNYHHSAECRNVIQKVMKIQKKMKKNAEVAKKSISVKTTKSSEKFDFDASTKKKFAKCAGW